MALASIGTARVLWRGNPGYEEARRGAVWNARKPDRFPDVIVVVSSDGDVIEAVDVARSRGMKVAVRAGGHSMCASPVRDGGMLIDLSGLRELSIDPRSRTAVVQPAVTGSELARALAEHELAFPVGHCASVPVSGFILAGGLGWNMGAWGPACFSLQAVEVVTAHGRLVTADDRQNTDLFWAARGAGPGFFGVATRFHVRLHPLPKAIRSSTYVYPLAEVEEVSRWAAEVTPQLPRTVEMQIGLFSAPPGAPAGPAGKAVGVSATAFAESEEEATRSLALMETCPAIGRALMRQAGQPSSFEALQETVGEKLPAGHRYLEDTLWSNEPLPALFPLLAEHMVSAPSPWSLVLAATLPSPPQGAPPPDAAFSKVARTFLLFYAIWDEEAGDAENEEWFHRLVGSVEPLSVGHYVAEADLPAGPSRSMRSFAPPNWEKLQSLRRRHDPDGLFHTYLGLE